MGAIRAVELEDYGMIGHGEIFEFYKKNPETSDDEVGLIHENSYPYAPITIPLVNLRILLTKLKNELEAKAVEKSIMYLSTISFDKRYFNVDYYKNNDITAELKEDLRLMILYKDFKTNDLHQTIRNIGQLVIDDVRRIIYNSNMNSIRLYIESDAIYPLTSNVSTKQAKI